MKTMKTMKMIKFLAITLAITSFLACSDDSDGNQLDVVSVTVEDLHAPQEGGMGQPISGPFTKFDFDTGMETDSETDWDIAFRGTTIIVNGGTSSGTIDEPSRNGDGGAYIATGTMADITEVDISLFLQDSESGLAITTGSGNGWYNYDFTTHVISPIAGKILVFKTADGRFAKVEILSYYQGAPDSPDGLIDQSRYYTFNYVYQPNSGETAF